MREILFKAKRIDNGEWAVGSLFVEGNRTEIVRGTCNGVGIEGVDVNLETVCQYTGLSDKNGQKIWENDIVRLDEDFYIVTWEEDDAMFALEDVGLIESFKNVDSKWCEVVGNIIDSPEFFNE